MALRTRDMKLEPCTRCDHVVGIITAAMSIINASIDSWRPLTGDSVILTFGVSALSSNDVIASFISSPT